MLLFSFVSAPPSVEAMNKSIFYIIGVIVVIVVVLHFLGVY